LSDARVREGLIRQGWSVEAGPPSALSNIFEEEIARYERVVQMGNIRIDLLALGGSSVTAYP